MFLLPIAYATILFFMVLIGLIGWGYLESLGTGMVRTTDFYVVLTSAMGFIFFYLSITIPLITMRLFSEEYSSGTYEALMTSPVSEWSVVLGKFFAAFSVYMILWLWTLVYAAVAYKFAKGEPDYGKITSFYLGVTLSGLVFVAAGALASSFAKDQIVSALIGILLCLGIWLFPNFFGNFPQMETYRETIQSFNLLLMTCDIAQGKLDSRALIFSLTTTLFFIFLTVKVIQSKRWR